MKIVQTFWPCEYSESYKDILNIKGGWTHVEYHWLSWALSCLQLRKYYKNVELVTNDIGKEILIDKFQLPYTSVSTGLNNIGINIIPKNLWAMSKIYSYGLQKEPFLHVDGDIYIWDKFPEEIIKSPLVAQNLEINLKCYDPGIKMIKKHFTYIPDSLQNALTKNEKVVACNAGVLGGQDVAFFKEFSSLAFEFVRRNNQHLHHITQDRYFNCVIEQYLFVCLSKQKNIDLKCLFDPILEGDDWGVFTDIFNVFNKNFNHILGQYKESAHSWDFITRKLRHEYPDYYYNIVNQLNQSKLLTSLKLYSSSQFSIETKEDKNGLRKTKINSNTRLNNSFFKVTNLEKEFYRTNAVFEEVFIEYKLTPLTFESIESLTAQVNERIGLLKNKQKKMLCTDVFKFELKRLKFLQKNRNEALLYLRTKSLETEVQKISKIEKDALLKQVFILNKTIKIISVKWIWHKLDLPKVKEQVKILINQPPDFIEVALVPHIDTLTIIEIGIPVVHSIVISAFKKKKLFSSAMTDITSFLTENGFGTDDENFEESIFNILKTGVSTDILRMG